MNTWKHRRLVAVAFLIFLSSGCEREAAPEPTASADPLLSFCRDAQAAVEVAIGVPHEGQVASSLEADAASLEQVGEIDLASMARHFAAILHELANRGPVIHVYFDDDVATTAIQGVEERLQRIPGVDSVTFESKKAAQRRTQSIMAVKHGFPQTVATRSLLQ